MNGRFITITGVVEDTSATILQEWLDNGYRELVWQYMEEPWQNNKKWLEMGGTCLICEPLNGQHFKIKDMLSDLAHNAPKYEKAHVGCKCLLKRVPREEEMLDYSDEMEMPATEAPGAQQEAMIGGPQ